MGTLEDVEGAKAFIADNEIAIVGFFKDIESADVKAFLGAAGSMDDYPFAITSVAAVFEEYKVADSGVVLFKNFDEGRNDLEGEVTEDAIVNFVSASAEDYSAKVDVAKGIAKDHKGEMLFVTIN